MRQIIVVNEIMQHYCGLFAVVNPEPTLTKIIINGLEKLQHRGQDSAGMSWVSDRVIKTYKGIGLVKDVFHNMPTQYSKIGIGHVRYSTRKKTTHENSLKETQPFTLSSDFGDFAFAHNGNIPNVETLRQKFDLDDSCCLGSESDSLVLAQIIQSLTKSKSNWTEVLKEFIEQIPGVYTALVLTTDSIFALKDRFGVRPLCVSTFENKCIISSESCAIPEKFQNDSLFEVEPGEIIQISPFFNEPKIVYKSTNTREQFCSFEHIYFFRHNTTYRGKNIREIRYRLGVELAKTEKHIVADVVVCVPQTSIPNAEGFAQTLHLPFLSEAIVKKRKANRTFILPNNEARQNACNDKFIYDTNVLKGKKIYLIDDSIVRGNTLKSVAEKLWECGVKEIHVRIPSPQLISECYYGIDMSTKKELVAHKFSKSEVQIANYLDIDTLRHLDISGMTNVFSTDNVCTSCFTGKYNKDLLDW